MQELREVKLPSGALLKVGIAPFADSRNLYQAILRQLGDVGISTQMEVSTMIAKLFCSSFASKEIESLLEVCWKKCTYNGEKITNDTFEDVDARQDYIKVCAEVARDNVLPFLKSLFAEFSVATQMFTSTPRSK